MFLVGRLLLTIFLVVLGGSAGASTASAPTFNYDPAAVERVDLDTAAWAGPARSGDVRFGSASPLASAQGTSTTPITRNNATNSGRSFDDARREAFERAFGPDWEENPAIYPSKWDPATGTAVEFKGPGGAKVGYDGPHPNTPGDCHDVNHISWQSAGKRGAGGERGNIPYDGPQHPSRPGR